MEKEVNVVEEQKQETLPTTSEKIQEKVPSNKKYTPIKIIAIFLILLSISMIGLGVYFIYASNPKKIIGSGIESMTANFKNIVFSTNENLTIGENFTIESDISINAQSDLFSTILQMGQPILIDPTMTNPAIQQEPIIQPETTVEASINMDMLNKMLTNIANTKNKVVIKQDKTNKKAFLSLNSMYNNENLLSAKYLIENSTEYYYVNGFLNTYVNNGSSNYFEAVNDQTTNQDNIIYLYEFISNSLKENLKEEYFVKEKVTTKIFDQEKDMTKVILKIDNLKAKEILSAILKDLKVDKKANDILTNYYEDFSKIKIKEDTVIFDKGEYIIINSYANNMKYDIEKVELIHIARENQTKIIYETNNSISKVALLENDKMTGYVEINKTSDNKYKLTIKDYTDKELGTITAEKTNQQTNVELDMSSEEGSRIYANYTSKASDIKDKSYKLKNEITLKILSNNTNIITATIKIDSNVSKDVEIQEDVSTSVLASTITETDKVRLEQVLTNAMTKLAS